MSDFAHSLKTWRTARRFSQLALALEAEVSARHISFLETGRARPSREMIVRLGEAMDLPLSARNALLNHAGFAPRYPARAWDVAEMAPIRAAVDHILTRHAPYPAISLDPLWRIERMNGPAQALYAALGLAEGGSLLDLMLSEELPQMIENWTEVAHHTAQRLRTESAAMGGIPALDAAAAKLARVPQPQAQSPQAVVPITLRLGDLRLSLFGTIAQFGTPEDVTVEAVRIELFFPADDPSRAALEGMAQS